MNCIAGIRSIHSVTVNGAHAPKEWVVLVVDPFPKKKPRASVHHVTPFVVSMRCNRFTQRYSIKKIQYFLSSISLSTPLCGNHRLEFLVSLIVLVKNHTLLTMIIEGTTGVKFLLTVVTRNRLRIRMGLHHFLHLLSKMNPQTMNDTITLRQGLKITVLHWATEFFLLFLF